MQNLQKQFKTKMITKERILIVDDNEENLSVLGNFLISKNYNVQFAETGEAALKTIERKVPDLILLDISMPGISGYEVCEILKKDDATAEIPIIFITAMSETKDVVKGFELGAVDYVTKPFNQAELLSRVKTHLELEHTKKALEQKNRELTQANATKDKFFRIIAHDLKSPFNSIFGVSELLEENINEYSRDEIQELISMISRTGQSTFKLLENLLEWSRSQTGQIKFKPEKVDTETIIQNAISQAESAAKMKNISVDYTNQTEEIFADENMIVTVLRNLINNSVKFTEEGGQIHIKTSNTNNEVLFEVSDTGIGMTQETISKLFKMGEKIGSLGTNNETGTGLGLILCKEFVEKHGGKIWAESEANKGSQFYFTLPLGK